MDSIRKCKDLALSLEKESLRHGINFTAPVDMKTRRLNKTV
jgi:hypothetical protein